MIRARNELTIIKSATGLFHYPFVVIPQDALELLIRCQARIPLRTEGALLKILEAYCHITNSEITVQILSSKEFTKIARGFLGALSSKSFFDCQGTATRKRYIKDFKKLLAQIHLELKTSWTPSQIGADEIQNQVIWKEAEARLTPIFAHYWSGWEIISPKGVSSYVAIPLIWQSHGQKFAEDFYKNYRQHAEKSLRPHHTIINKLIKKISNNPEKWPPKTFKHPLKINELFTEFMIDHFKDALASGNDLYSQTRAYSKFISTIDQSFLQTGVWAKPFTGGFPKPPSKNSTGTNTNIRETAEGLLVKDKLLTLVPLCITDSEAIDILFREVEDDISLAVGWAKRKAHKIRRVQLRRDKLAQLDSPMSKRYPNAKSFEDIGISKICATFDAHGLSYLRESTPKKFGAITKKQLSTLLGIPTSRDLLAFKILLIKDNPCITDSFLENFELYNKSDQISGLIKNVNGSYELIGYKDRRGGSLSEQRVLLSARSAVLIRQVQEITEPLRKELKQTGDDAWRYLFLYCKKYIGFPAPSNRHRVNCWTATSITEQLIFEFQELSDRPREKLEQFIYRLTPTKFRASCGVAEYLKTQSVEKMAKALGHAKYTPALLSSYLPEPILSFFQSRWIRIFQKGIICQAMKNSPYLLHAAKFNSINELHEFLTHHALKDILKHLENPDHPVPIEISSEKRKAEMQADRILVSLDAGILTILLSLRDAVEKCTDKSLLCGKAKYWSKFANLITQEITRGWNSEPQDHLSVATKHVDPSIMERLIYATTS